VEVAEQYADRQVKNAAREQAHWAVRALLTPPRVAADVSLAYNVSRGPRYTHVDAGIVAQRAVFAIAATGAQDAERAVQCELFRDIIGNPFRPAVLDRHWKTATTFALAQSIHEDLAFDRMPILADALEEVGCTEAEILSHCRGPGPHVRGCWVVDLVLGKE
jgi:hypothetical protein